MNFYLRINKTPDTSAHLRLKRTQFILIVLLSTINKHIQNSPITYLIEIVANKIILLIYY